MNTPFENITAKVAAIDTVVAGAAALITHLAQRIRDSLIDPDALQRLADDLDAHAVSLGAAIAENADLAAPQPVPPEPVVEEFEAPAPIVATSNDTISSGIGDGSFPDSATGSDSVAGSTIGGEAGEDVVIEPGQLADLEPEAGATVVHDASLTDFAAADAAAKSEAVEAAEVEDTAGE